MTTVHGQTMATNLRLAFVNIWNSARVIDKKAYASMNKKQTNVINKEYRQLVQKVIDKEQFPSSSYRSEVVPSMSRIG